MKKLLTLGIVTSTLLIATAGYAVDVVGKYTGKIVISQADIDAGVAQFEKMSGKKMDAAQRQQMMAVMSNVKNMVLNLELMKGGKGKMVSPGAKGPSSITWKLSGSVITLTAPGPKGNQDIKGKVSPDGKTITIDSSMNKNAAGPTGRGSLIFKRN